MRSQSRSPSRRLRPTISRADGRNQVARARVGGVQRLLDHACDSVGLAAQAREQATLVGVHGRRRDERVEADVRPVVGRCLCELAGGGGGELGADDPRLDEDDLDPEPGHLEAQCVGERLDRVFRRVVRGGAGKGELAAHRADVDDATASLAAHARQDEAAQLHRREHVRLELTLHTVGRDGLERTRLAVARVVDERRDEAVALLDRRDRSASRRIVGDVELEQLAAVRAQIPRSTRRCVRSRTPATCRCGRAVSRWRDRCPSSSP